MGGGGLQASPNYDFLWTVKDFAKDAWVYDAPILVFEKSNAATMPVGETIFETKNYQVRRLPAPGPGLAGPGHRHAAAGPQAGARRGDRLAQDRPAAARITCSRTTARGGAGGPPHGTVVRALRQDSPGDDADIVAEVDVTEPTTFMVRESWHPRWHAYIDGVEVPVRRVTPDFPAVDVAARPSRDRVPLRAPVVGARLVARVAARPAARVAGHAPTPARDPPRDGSRLARASRASRRRGASIVSVEQDDAALALSDDPGLLGPPSDELPPRDEFLRVIGATEQQGQRPAARPARALQARRAARRAADRDRAARPLHRRRPRRRHRRPPGARPARVAGRRARAAAGGAAAVPGLARRGARGHPRRSSCSARSACPTTAACSPRPPTGSTRRFLPEPPAIHELWRLAGHIIRKLDDLAWLGPGRRSAARPARRSPAAMPGSRCARRSSTRSACSPPGSPRSAWTRRCAPARSTETLRNSPLYRLTRAGLPEMPALIAASRDHLEHVRNALEDHGVSIDVVYSIDSIERGLSRLELLLPFVGPDARRAPSYEHPRGDRGGRPRPGRRPQLHPAAQRQPAAARAQGDRARRPHRRALRHVVAPRVLADARLGGGRRRPDLRHRGRPSSSSSGATSRRSSTACCRRSSTPAAS